MRRSFVHLPAKIVRQLKEEMQTQKKTYEALGEVVGMSRSNLHGYLNGNRPMTAFLGQRVAKALGMDLQVEFSLKRIVDIKKTDQKIPHKKR